MPETQNVSSRLQFRNLRVEEYEPREFLPGYGDGDDVDVSNFSGKHYIVKFEVRDGEEGDWLKVKGTT